MIKTKIESAEDIRNSNQRDLVIAEINELFYAMKAKSMPHGSKEKIAFMAKSNEQVGIQNENKMVIRAIDIIIARYKKEESEKK